MRIVIFGGTTEGRQLVEYLVKLNQETEEQSFIHVCVASEYGADVLPERPDVQVHVGRMKMEEMKTFLQKIQADICVDATHPYAVYVTQNIYRACGEIHVPYVRVKRDFSDAAEKWKMSDECVFVENTQAAVDFLKETEGNILITTGSKELSLFTQIPDYKMRCTARVLPVKEVVETCTELGFCGKHLICMQGPFDAAMNRATLRYADADWLVTKASGKNGGYDEKCEAALKLGVHTIVIGRPQETVEPVMTLEEAKHFCSELKKGHAIWEIQRKQSYI